MRRGVAALAAWPLAAWPLAAWAQEASGVDSGDTAWMLTSVALVLFMTIPGLALFYGGLVRAKNVLSVLMQCFVITCLVTVLWAVIGYSMSFSRDGMAQGEWGLAAFVGGASRAFLRGVTWGSVHPNAGSIPEAVYACFQLTFAIITPGLIIGAFAERMRFSAMLWFMGAWSLLVYAPVAHMVWGGPGAFLADLGTLDYAGGIVVHLSAGIAALVSAVMLGKRQGYPDTPMPPHSLTLAVVGAGMLWVGWFGFNAGSACGANDRAGMAMLATQLAASMAALTWMFVEWKRYGKPSVLGFVTGAVAGLATVTPASGYIGPMGALAIGFVAGVVCFYAATSMKRALGYDDSLDAFGVHGVGGTIGALLTGVFAAKSMGGHEDVSIAGQFMAQCIGVGVTLVWSGVVSYLILKAIDLTIGLRVSAQEEVEGLDLTQHNEAGYNL